jgi:hypothetical protein
MINKVWKSNFNMVQLLGIVKMVTNYNRRSTLQLCHCFGLLTDDSHSLRPGEEAGANQFWFFLGGKSVLISEPCGNDLEPSPEGKAAHGAVVWSRRSAMGGGGGALGVGCTPRAQHFFRSSGTQFFGGAHNGRVCVRVFIGVSLCACCERLCCTVWISKKKNKSNKRGR